MEIQHKYCWKIHVNWPLPPDLIIMLGLKNNPCFLPGLYSVVEFPDKETGEMIKWYAYTIITRAANDTMKMIHNGGENKCRMPLFLPFELSKKWVEEELSVEDYKSILDFEMPSEGLTCHNSVSIKSLNAGKWARRS